MTTLRAAAFFLIAIACSLAAAGDWYWLPAGNGLYVRASATGNDGIYYRYSCGRYTAVQQINASQTVNIQAPADWKAKIVSALDRQRENDYFLAALRESGLTPDLQSQGGQASSYGNAYASTATIQTQSGTGYHGVLSHAPSIGQVDIEALLEKNARIVERMAQGTDHAAAAMSDRIGEISHGQAEALKIQAAGAALVASIQATQTNRATTATITTGPGVPPPEPMPPGDFRPAVASPTSAIARVRAEALLTSKCGKCHIEDAKGDFVLERLDGPTFERIWNAVHSEKKPMPPRDSGIAPLTAREKLTLSKAAP